MEGDAAAAAIRRVVERRRVPPLQVDYLYDILTNFTTRNKTNLCPT